MQLVFLKTSNTNIFFDTTFFNPASIYFSVILTFC